MAKYRHRTLDIYDAELYLATDLQQWRNLRRSVDALDLDKIPGANGLTDLQVEQTNDGRNVPHIPVFIDVAALTDPALLVNTCAHEAAHVSGLLLDHLGQEAGNSEAHAYLVGWVAAWLWQGCHG